MRLLEFSVKGFFLPSIYPIACDGAPIGKIESDMFWESATITIGGASYSATREGYLSGAFYLAADGHRLVSAEKPSAWKSLFTVQVGGRTYTLRPANDWPPTLVLTEHELKIGRIAWQNAFMRKGKAELPDDLALEVKAFLIWLVILLLRRNQGTPV
jgi:hypothetical protein